MNAPSAAKTSLTPGQRVILILLTLYRGFVSQLFAGSCRFTPSCSEYARDAVTQHGALRGSWLAARRVARCHPGGSYGLDPVPPVDSQTLGAKAIAATRIVGRP